MDCIGGGLHIQVLQVCQISNIYTARLLAAAQCIVIGHVGGFVCVFVGGCVWLWVCYHDNSKLRASILTKLGL